MKSKRGYAAIVLVFIIGLVGTLLSLTLLTSGFIESTGGRATTNSDQALFAAESALEDVRFKIANDVSFTLPISLSIPISPPVKVATGTATSIIDNTPLQQKTILVTGISGQYVRRIQSILQNTSVESGFLYAVEAFNGGFELANNAFVTGDVYSTGDIMGGSSNNNCNPNSSIIDGVATTSASFSSYTDPDTHKVGNGVCVYKDAYANNFANCYIKGKSFYKTTPPVSSSCPFVPPVSPILSIDDAKPPLSDEFIDETTKNLGDPNLFPPGNCVVGGSPDCSVMVNGTPTIGSQIINGDLRINSNSINLSGPVSVIGNLFIDSQTKVGLSNLVSCDDTSCISQLLVVDGQIIVYAHLTFVPKISSTGTKKAYVLPISRYDPREHGLTSSDICSDPYKISIETYSNITNVLFYAPHGCLWIKNTGVAEYLGGAAAEKVHLVKGTLKYDYGLRDAVFGSTALGGWRTKSFTEY